MYLEGAERIQKVLARSNIASRRGVEKLILEGRVRVNNKKLNTLGEKVAPGRDVVHVDGRLVSLFPAHEIEPLFVLLNKPSSVVVTLKDNFARKSVMDLLPEYKKARLFPVGRLDYDAQGALLLTNDGELAQKLLSPKSRCPKIYLVKVKGTPKEEDLAKLRRGIYLEDGPTGSCKIENHRATQNNTWLKVTLTSGKYRQLKRMFFRIKNPVMRILRTDFAGLNLGNLAIGEHRELNKKEITKLSQII